jgi:DNA-binding winged helix-turn-helix (wHTH) protein
MLAIFLIASSFTRPSDSDVLAKQVNLIMRQIGHRLLLQAGDSTSRVMPVTEIKEGTFRLEFENAFVFNHDSLMTLTKDLLPETQFPAGYTVTVHDCMTANIVYGFQINNSLPDILPCQGRSQPTGCYTIEIAFLDLYENPEWREADVDPLTRELKSFKTDPLEAKPKPEEPKSYNVDPEETNRKPEELTSSIADLQEANPKLDEFKTTTSDFPLVNLVYTGLLVLLGVTMFITRFGKNLMPVPLQNQNHAKMEVSVQELAALGKFSFDVNGQRLLLGSVVISLTDKECRILELLNKNFGQLITRETLMQEVWIKEGVITGRSRDMFVSKLRKKLSSDPALRITNVHGKGYKLEIPEMRI